MVRLCGINSADAATRTAAIDALLQKQFPDESFDKSVDTLSPFF